MDTVGSCSGPVLFLYLVRLFAGVRRLRATVAFLTLMSLYSAAQTTPNLEVGYTLFGSFHGSEMDSVNLNNRKLELHIPLLSYPQRGGKLHFGFYLHYSGPVYTETRNCYPFGPGNTNICADIWSWDSPPGVNLVPDFFMTTTGNVVVNGGAQLVTAAVVTADGAVHQMGNLDNTYNLTNGYRPSLWESSDGSKIRYQENADRSSVITDSKGVRYYLQTGLLEDSNGNQITQNSGGWTDSVGRFIPFPPATNPGTYPTFNGNSALCTGPLPTVGAAAWNVPGYGGTAQITFCYANLVVNPPLPGPPRPPNFPDSRTPAGTYLVLQSVVLPPQPGEPPLVYTFQYDTTQGWGDLTKVTYSSGGSISYAWNNFRGCHYPPLDELDLENRGVAARAISDGVSSNIWTYSGGDTRIGSTNQTSNAVTVIDPAGNNEVHTFSALAGCSFYETQVDSYQLINGAQSLLKSVQTQYYFLVDPNNPPGSPSIPPGAINVLPKQVTTIWADGQTSEIEKQYDAGFTLFDINGTTVNALYGTSKLDKEHDYASGSPGAVLRQTSTTSQWEVNPNYDPKANGWATRPSWSRSDASTNSKS